MAVTVTFSHPGEDEELIKSYHVWRHPATAEEVRVTGPEGVAADGSASYSFYDPGGKDGDEYAVTAVSLLGVESEPSGVLYAEARPEVLEFFCEADCGTTNPKFVAVIKNVLNGTPELVYYSSSDFVLDQREMVLTGGDTLKGTWKNALSVDTTDTGGHYARVEVSNNGGEEISTLML